MGDGKVVRGAGGDKVECGGVFRLASGGRMAFPARTMSSLPTADLLALDLDGLKSRLSKLRRYL